MTVVNILLTHLYVMLWSAVTEHLIMRYKMLHITKELLKPSNTFNHIQNSF